MHFIVARTGSCLSVRERWRAESGLLDCLADGTQVTLGPVGAQLWENARGGALLGGPGRTANVGPGSNARPAKLIGSPASIPTGPHDLRSSNLLGWRKPCEPACPGRLATASDIVLWLPQNEATKGLVTAVAQSTCRAELTGATEAYESRRGPLEPVARQASSTYRQRDSQVLNRPFASTRGRRLKRRRGLRLQTARISDLTGTE